MSAHTIPRSELPYYGWSKQLRISAIVTRRLPRRPISSPNTEVLHRAMSLTMVGGGERDQ